MPNTNTNKSKTGTLRQFRQMLVDKSQEVKSQMTSATGIPALQVHEDPYDTADWAEKSHEEWIFLKKNSFDMAVLRDIEEALERLRDGTYGVCMECGLPVSMKRLEVMPWARFCVSCQERHHSGNN